MLSLEAMKIDRVRTEVSVQYVDHNILQIDNLNAEDHLFLESACRRFGLWYSPPGNGISHVVHMERFGRPGKSLLGSDSHTPAAGALCMFAFGAGGLDVALAMAGEPYAIAAPRILGVELTGALPPRVSAKDVILELLLRRGHAVMAGENYGQGSSREHAATAPRYLGLRLVLAKSFARIHRQNLINCGVLALRFADPGDYDRLVAGDVLQADNLRRSLEQGESIALRYDGLEIEPWHDLTADQIETILAGGVINRRRQDAA